MTLWVLLGDFNVILEICENSSVLNVNGKGMEDFRDCVDNLGIEDISMCGMFYTWIQ